MSQVTEFDSVAIARRAAELMNVRGTKHRFSPIDAERYVALLHDPEFAAAWGERVGDRTAEAIGALASAPRTPGDLQAAAELGNERLEAIFPGRPLWVKALLGVHQAWAELENPPEVTGRAYSEVR